MENRENNSAVYSPEIKDNNENYHQPQIDGKDQTVIVDHQVTAETDELDSAFHSQDPPVRPEDEQEKDENLSEEEDQEDDNFDLNHDADDDLSLNIDDEELN